MATATKAEKKTANPKDAKATKAAATPKAETNGRARKDGLRKAQIRILQLLSKASNPLTRPEIAKKAPCDLANCTELIGSHNDDVRKANDAKHFPSLRSLGFVRVEVHDIDGKDVFHHSITATGRKALEKALKAE